MVVNSQTKVTLDLADVRAFARKLSAALRLEGQHFNVCFVDDSRIRQLNAEFRGKPKPTDVLSFPWRQPCFGPQTQADSSLRFASLRMTVVSECHPERSEGAAFRCCAPSEGGEIRWGDEFKGFLGDIVISAETARRNAALAGHFTQREIRLLILHGLLHLLGYDHERDHGEMTRLELSLRGRVGVDGLKGKSKRKSIGQKQGLPVYGRR